MKKLAILFVTLLSGLSLSFAQVQVAVPTLYGDVDPEAENQCLSLSNNLRLYARDATTNGEVSMLQDFLNTQGYLTSLPTGYFGQATFAAAKKFQAANGLLNSGFVGALTRGKIKDISCSGGASVTVESTGGRGIGNTDTGGTSLPAGCTASTLFSPMTGEKCVAGVVLPVPATLDRIAEEEKIKIFSDSEFAKVKVFFDSEFAKIQVFVDSTTLIIKNESQMVKLKSLAEDQSPKNKSLAEDQLAKLRMFAGDQQSKLSLTNPLDQYTVNALAKERDNMSAQLAKGRESFSIQTESARKRFLLDNNLTSQPVSGGLFRVERDALNPLTVQAEYSLLSPCTSFTLDWGDGTNSNFKAPSGVYCTQVIETYTKTHTYSQPGTYTVKFQTGNSPQVSFPITVGGTKCPLPGTVPVCPGTSTQVPYNNQTCTWDWNVCNTTQGLNTVNVTVSSGGTDSLTIGAFSKIGEFTVAVGSKGGIMLASSTLELSISGITNPQITYDQVQIREGGSWLNAAQVFPHTENGVMKLGINLRQGYGFDVNAGQSRTFSVYATIKGQAQPGIIPCVQSKFNSTNPHFSFFDISRSPTLWRDARSISNFPTNAYSTKDCSQISQVSKPTFALTAGFTSQTVSPNTTGVKVGSFTIQAPSNEAIKVSQLTATPAITSGPVYNVTNLSIKSNGSSLGIPVANPLGAYATFSFPEITIQAGQTRVFDVYADIGSASPASVKTAMTVWYKGAVNNTSGTVSAEGVNISSVVAGGLSATLSPLSPVSQYVVGCSSFNIATFKIKTTTPGTSVVVEGLRFAATGGDTIRSITVAGITRDFSAPFSGLSIPVSSTGVDVPVTVAFNGLQDSLCGGPLIASVPNVSLILKEVVGRSGGSTVVGPVNVSSNQMTLVASKPTVAMKQGGTSPLVLNGGETKIAEFTVSADLQGGLAIDSLKLAPTVSASGVTFSNPRIAGIDGTIPSATLSVEPIYTTLQTIVVKFNQGYEIGAGKTETFSVYAKVTSSIPVNTSFFIATRFLSPLDFKWRDIVGGNTLLDGSKIMNFPTGAYRTGDILTTPAANITSVTPSQGTAGTVVTINGNYLSGITRVEFIKATYEVVGVLQASQMTTVTPSAVTFTLPSIITTAIAPGNNYQVRVVSSGCTTGCTSNMLPFTFTTPVTPVAPTINTLYINPPALLAGQTTNLHWSTTNATSCTLNGIPQPQAANGISPITSAGTYTLSCTGPGGSVTKSFTVASQPTVTLPTITSFVASPSSIQSGQSTVISWSTKDATICTLNGAPQSQVVNGVSVGQGGNYTLACSGPGGNVSKSLTVSVYVVDPVICQDGRPPVNGTCQPTPVLTPIYSSQVTALYRVFLGRAPDSVGAPYFQQKLNSGTTITDAGWEMLTSPEGTTKWGGVATTISNEAYIDLLYKILLGYTPTAEIRNSWVQTLANGTSRKDILQQFISYPDTRTKNPDLFMVPATNSFQVLASSIRSLESVYREATQGTVALSAPTTLTAVTEEIINFTGLQRGANEVRVSSLKKILNTISPSVSIGCANLSTTNTLYGPTTEECVRVFQNLNELEPTGSVNEQTNKALNRVLAR